MSFQAVGPEELKKRSPKLAVQDRGPSSLFASAERNRGRPGTEVSNEQEKGGFRGRGKGPWPPRMPNIVQHDTETTQSWCAPQ